MYQMMASMLVLSKQHRNLQVGLRPEVNSIKNRFIWFILEVDPYRPGSITYNHLQYPINKYQQYSALRINQFITIKHGQLQINRCDGTVSSQSIRAKS